MKTNIIKSKGQKRLELENGEVWSIQSGTRKRFYLIHKKRSKITNKELKYSEVLDILIYNQINNL